MISRIFSPVQQFYQTFIVEVKLWLSLLGRGTLSRTIFADTTSCARATQSALLERITGADPVPTVWKTAILLLYDTRIFFVFFRFLHIYYIRFLKENQIFVVGASGGTRTLTSCDNGV